MVFRIERPSLFLYSQISSIFYRLNQCIPVKDVCTYPGYSIISGKEKSYKTLISYFQTANIEKNNLTLNVN